MRTSFTTPYYDRMISLPDTLPAGNTYGPKELDELFLLRKFAQTSDKHLFFSRARIGSLLLPLWVRDEDIHGQPRLKLPFVQL
jgi:hypothetical protein